MTTNRQINPITRVIDSTQYDAWNTAQHTLLTDYLPYMAMYEEKHNQSEDRTSVMIGHRTHHTDLDNVPDILDISEAFSRQLDALTMNLGQHHYEEQQLNTHTQTDRQTDRRRHKHTQTHSQRPRHTHRQTYRHTDMHAVTNAHNIAIT